MSKIHYNDAKRNTRVNSDASHIGFGPHFGCAPISFASRYLNVQEKKYSTNKLELLAAVWAVDRYKHYLLGKEFTIATDH